MSLPNAIYDELRQAKEAGGVSAVLDRLTDQLRREKRYHDLFEALKMRLRHSLGLPLMWQEAGDRLDVQTRDRLEEGLLAACREVGLSLLADGQIRDGWMYLRPVGDVKAAAEAIAKIDVDEDNLDDYIGVTLNEGVDVARGYSLVLEHYGTCNAITTFEGDIARRPPKDQTAAAALLLRHVHQELLATVKADIAQQEGAEPAENTLTELIADRPWLFADHSYHIDTTHLAATVRFAKTLTDESDLRLALDLTEYGRRLSQQFQFQGDEPFVDNYPSHALFFQALLGENVDEALAYFKGRAEALDPREHGPAAAEVYVNLLSRVGRAAEAVEARIRLLPPEIQTWGVAPTLLELSEQSRDYDKMMEHCQSRDDLVGFAAALVEAKTAESD